VRILELQVAWIYLATGLEKLGGLVVTPSSCGMNTSWIVRPNDFAPLFTLWRDIGVRG
jgi:hypothetical protein